MIESYRFDFRESLLPARASGLARALVGTITVCPQDILNRCVDGSMRSLFQAMQQVLLIKPKDNNRSSSFREVMWFREDRGALEAPLNSENSCEDRRTLSKTPRELTNRSKMAIFSISSEAEKWPPFPRQESRGPIEARHKQHGA